MNLIKMLVLCFVLNSCAVFNTEPPPMTMPLAPPVAPARRVVQQITAHWQNREATLLCVLELDKHHIAMAGLSNEGLSLFNLNYDGKQLSVEKTPLFTDALAPEFIMADFQLVYWSIAELQKILPNPWRLVASPLKRELYYRDEKIAAVQYLAPATDWAKNVELTNYRYHYQLHIKPYPP